MALVLKSYAAVVIEWDRPFSGGLKILEQIRKMQLQLPLVALISHSEAAKHRFDQDEAPPDYLQLTGDEKVDLSRFFARLEQIFPEFQSWAALGRDLLWLKTQNKKMMGVMALVDIVKEEPSSVLIQGENGTGKEVIAWILHHSGKRHAKPFVAINCAAIPETLLESELFGHEKGAFTGATEKKIGKFEAANEGTAFLDEIGDMPLNTQAKILRALQTGEIERVGGHEKIPAELRIVTATNQNLLELIEKGRFRRDLYYRINTFRINLPPLRERREDLLPLAQHFLDLTMARKGGGPRKRLSKATERLVLEYNWPGNVRELRNVMERVAVLTPGTLIGPEVLQIGEEQDSSITLKQPQQWGPSDSGHSRILSLEEVERRAILEALAQLGNNTTEAAKRLGIARATLYRKLKRYGISRQLPAWS